ncbi:MAG: TIM barrel protein [Patescibacteria group bacterium]|jgi:sugar phosphate isomerase/epimerase
MNMERKIGIISDEIALDLETQLKWCEEYRIRAVQIRTVDGVGVKNITPSHALEIADSFRRIGTRVELLAANLGECCLSNSQQADAQIEDCKRLVVLAPHFGTKIIRAFAGFREKDIQFGWEYVLSFFRKVLEILPEDFVLVVENEPATYCPTPMEVLALSKELKDPRIRLLIDIGNLGFAPEIINAVRLAGSCSSEVAEKMTKMCHQIIGAVHIKNTFVRGMESRTVALNAGHFNLETHIEQLAGFGLGHLPICLEPYRPPQTDDETVLDEAMQAMPGGSGYGNLAAAEEDLNILRGWLGLPTIMGQREE